MISKTDRIGTAGKTVTGVIGGMGPLASAEFLKTIYEQNLCEHEQQSPIVVMLSDPTFPARTQEFPKQSFAALYDKLIESLRRIDEMGVSKIVLCCVTMHHFLGDLPAPVRSKIISLLDVIFQEVEKSATSHLVITSNETRQTELFQKHSRWPAAKDRFVWPGGEDQQAIAENILRIKKNQDIGQMVPFLETLLARYGVRSFIVACTEIHILAKEFDRSRGLTKGYGCIDPLTIIAKGLGRDIL